MGAQKNKPAVRFKGFTEEWIPQELSQIIELNSGRDYKHLSKGIIPVYGTGGYMLSVNEALSYENDAIGIGRKGTIDKPYLLKAPFWTVDTLFYAIPKLDNDINFINSIFRRIDWKEKDESTGVPSLSKVTINSIKVIIPKFNEQKKLGTLFSNIDKLLENHQTQLTKLKNLKKAMLTKMFPQGAATLPEIRFKSFEGEWESFQLGNIGSTFTGLSGKTKEDFGKGAARYIPYTNVFNNEITDRNQLENIEIDNTQHSVQYGDLLFTTSSETPEEVGMSSVWLENDDNVYLNSFCFGYRFENKVDCHFIAYYMRSQYFRENMKILAQGISRFNISKTKVLEIDVLFPDDNEQFKIGKYFTNLDELISGHRIQFEKLNNIKKACLNKLFVS